MPTTDRAERTRLDAEARYHRDRLALYRARIVSSKPASAASRAADVRLRAARSG